MRLSLILDGNFFLMKLVFPLINMNTLYGDLMRALEINFKKHVEIYPFHQIWFVSDSKFTWRKELVADYKANRVKDDKIDWEFIFNTYDEFKQTLDPVRFKTAEAGGLEGDDWIAHIVKRSNENGISCLVMSSDSDLQQLLRWRLNPDYINMQYKDNIGYEKVYAPEGYQIFINNIRRRELDLFELDWKQDFLNLMDALKKTHTIEEVDPVKLIFKKLVMGDKKDNVMALLTTYTTTNKPRGIGDAGANKIWDKFRDINPDLFDYDSEEFANDVTELVCEYKKVPMNDENSATVKDKLKNNLKLLRLEKHYMPEKYYEIIDEKLNTDLRR